MPHLHIGNEIVDTDQIKRLIKSNIAHFQAKIERLNMNDKLGVRMLCFYSERINDQSMLLKWIVQAEKAAEQKEAA